MTPDELLENLKMSATKRKQRSLDIIHEVCREQHGRGSQDFSIAMIGRLSEEKGGPKTQPIRNKGGEDYRALISSWADYTGGSMKKLPKQPENPLFAVLEKIPDPAVRAVMGNVLAENKKLKGQVNLLKSQADVVIDQRPIGAYRSRTGQQVGEVFPLSVELTDSEREALRHAVSEEFMENQGWAIEASGRVRNAKGRSLYKAGYATAIRKILGD